MKRMQCECCGAALPIPSRYEQYIKCEYCNATYKVDNNSPEVHYILYEPGYIKTIAAKLEIPDTQFQYRTKETMMPYIRKELARQIAEFLEDKITIYENWDIYNFSTNFQARIKIDTRHI